MMEFKFTLQCWSQIFVITVKGTITIARTEADLTARQTYERSK